MSPSSYSPGDILALASALRNDRTWPSLCFGTDVRPFMGGGSLIYALRFPDEVAWAFHVFAQDDTSSTADSVASLAQSQATTFTVLHESGFQRSPKLIHHDVGHNNPIKAPYLVLSWIPGTALEWTDTSPSEPQCREKIMRQVVNIQLELAECTKVASVGSSTYECLCQTVDRKIMRVVDGKEPSITIIDCLEHRALLQHAVHRSLEFEPPIYAISHEDLAARNIIVDSDYNITGLIGWTSARILPLQLAFRLPRFLATEPDSPIEPVSQLPSDIDLSTFAVQYLHPSPSLIVDRHLVRMHLASLIAGHDHPERGSLAQVMRHVHSDPDVSWQYLIIEACFTEGLAAWLSNRNWLLGGTKGQMSRLGDVPREAIGKEAEKFLAANDGIDQAVREAVLRACGT
ncbi:uncharacterized protein C8A04DRAFT_36498 [Dichotomopilus funicola]|uniref:Aminoglycoside phosphotransferase domain-containing protein n=1 Tax=Dichotomopilus funicola TaxID=1934379 RepID=A0AAN6V426_9PEZI|nr:hypothetical protein C8A04DRAFT_36498 [Dichotomopilus funicola]